MELIIEAKGNALRYLEPNAAALGIHDPDRIGPDPLLLWLRGAAAGFADTGPNAAPRLTLRGSEFNPEHDQQRWRIDVQDLSRGQLLVVRNLLLAREVTAVWMYVAGESSPLPLHRLAYPTVAPAAGIDWDYTPPDSDDIVRQRCLRIELAEAPDTTLARRLTDELNLWTEMVCRSGWCPPDQEPANAGAMPTFAYALDSHTLAVDFDGIFRVDEACFDAIAAYTHRLYSQGVAVARITVR